jgi:hypothetical protein
MIRIVATLDYEIHGNGHGCSKALMLKPTERLLKLFNEHEARLTIMADVAEILKFRDYRQERGQDHYHAEAIEAQLQDAVAKGHDVQLHLHPSYFNARHVDGHWQQDWSEYDFARLDYARMDWMIKTGKSYLEGLLQPVKPDYRCIAFRAANWAMQPSEPAIRVLVDNGFLIDTSVFKYGRRNHPVHFDYTLAHSSFLPWPVAGDDICRRDGQGRLIELPIYSEHRSLWSFLTLNRLLRVLKGWPHRLQQPTRPQPEALRPHRLPWQERHAWKADLNQSTGQQLIGVLNTLKAYQNTHLDELIPLVLIGHSKLFNAWNARSLQLFLAYCRQGHHRMCFDTLQTLSVELDTMYRNGHL